MNDSEWIPFLHLLTQSFSEVFSCLWAILSPRIRPLVHHMHRFRLFGLFPHNSPSRSFFLSHRGKGGSQCDSCPFFYHSWMQSIFWTIQIAPLTFQYTRRAFIKFSQIHVPHFKWRNADPMVWGLYGNLSGIRPVHNSSSPLWISWELVPTRFRLLYKAPRGIVLPHFTDSWVLEKSQVLRLYGPSQWPWQDDNQSPRNGMAKDKDEGKETKPSSKTRAAVKI